LRWAPFAPHLFIRTDWCDVNTYQQTTGLPARGLMINLEGAFANAAGNSENLPRST
jgi:hypothetical protein